MAKFKGKEITREDVIIELAKYDKDYTDTNLYNNWLSDGTYLFALKYKGKLYPPKYILSNLSGLSVSEFSGGDETNKFFESLGFAIRDKSDHIKYWKIAPGPKAKFWERCLNDGNIAVGWTELGNISHLIGNYEEYKKIYADLYKDKQGSQFKSEMNQFWQFMHLEVNDIIIANDGLNFIVGEGKVSGGFEYREDYAEYRNTIPVEWVDKTRRPVPDHAKHMTKRWWTNTLEELSKAKHDQLLGNYEPPIEIEKEHSGSENINKKYEEYHHQGRIEFITFHPSYSYEEFIEGITVEIEGENKPSKDLQYKLKPGIFKNICKRALAMAITPSDEEKSSSSWKAVYEEYLEKKNAVDFAKAPKHVLIIDEINRGDMAKIFGELITLLEADKRIGEINQLIVRLPTSGDLFGVPPNVYIIATMNTADRSIALLDVALRRRFGFIEMNPDFGVLEIEHINKNIDKLKKNGVYDLLMKSKDALQKINEKLCIDPAIGRDRQIGHSFLFKVETLNDLHRVWKHEILPLMEEYCYSDYQKINRMLFSKDSDTQWISKSRGIGEIKDLNEMVELILKSE